MNQDPQAILEAARAAIEAGESPDDVARWIQEATGMSIDELVAHRDALLRVAKSGNPVTDFLHQALAKPVSAMMPAGKGYSDASRGRSGEFQQRTEDLQLLAPGASKLAGMAPLLAGGGVAGLRGLGAAGRAIQAARVGAPRATGLLDALGRPIMAPTSRSAVEALRALAQNPALRSAGRVAGSVGRGVGRLAPLGLALEALRRVSK